MANQWKRRTRTLMVCAALLSFVPATTASTSVSVEDPTQLPEPEVDPLWLLEDDGDPFFLWLWDHYPQTTYGGKLCDLAVDTLQRADGANATAEAPDPDSENGIDPLRYHECREVRDEAQRQLWEAYGGETQTYECYRPYIDGWGVTSYRSVLPFSVCYGTQMYDCDIIIQHVSYICLNGIFPE